MNLYLKTNISGVVNQNQKAGGSYLVLIIILFNF